VWSPPLPPPLPGENKAKTRRGGSREAVSARSLLFVHGAQTIFLLSRRRDLRALGATEQTTELEMQPAAMMAM
jgi:hypothetical protein